MAYQSINPFTNQVEKTFENTTDKELEQTLTTAHQLYLDWRKYNDLEERKRQILKLGQILRERRVEYATVMSKEMGKLISEAEGEVDLCASFCDIMQPMQMNLCNQKSLRQRVAAPKF